MEAKATTHGDNGRQGSKVDRSKEHVVDAAHEQEEGGPRSERSAGAFEARLKDCPMPSAWKGAQG